MADLTFKRSDLHGHITLNDNPDPDVNFFKQKNLETVYLSTTDFPSFCKNKGIDSTNSSLLNLGIRSMHKHFDNLKSMQRNLNYYFKILCLTEIWRKGDALQHDSNLQISEYSVIHQSRANENHTGGGVCVVFLSTILFLSNNEMI